MDAAKRSPSTRRPTVWLTPIIGAWRCSSTPLWACNPLRPARTPNRGATEYPEWVRRAKRTEDYYASTMLARFLATIQVEPAASEAAPEGEVDEAKLAVQRAPVVAIA